MRGPIRSILVAALAICAFAALTVGQASAANMKIVAKTPGFLAIYGNPGTNGETVPVGGGLGRNFGFGENMLFEANTTKEIGKNLKIELEGGTTAEAKESFLGGTLMSNKTGENNPLSFAIQFADFQNNLVSGAATPSYTDTFDRPWIAEICAPAAAEKACKTDAQFAEPATKGGVKIENVSFDLGGDIIQGTVWGKWANGKPPCITLEKPPAASPTLVGTQPAAIVGVKVAKVEGVACLISANNDYYEGHKEEIEIENK